MNKTNFKSILAVLLTVVMVFSIVPAFAVSAAETTATKITSADQLVTGQYVIATTNDFAMSPLSGTWVMPATVSPADGKITEVATNLIWTITVDGTSVTLTDANGVTIKPKAGNNNGIESGNYKWAVSFANGAFRFSGVGSDTTRLACNHDATNGQDRFRSYKNSTLDGSTGSKYTSDFYLYKVEGDITPEAPVVPQDPAADSTLTVEEVIALGLSKAHNVYTTNKYYVTGVITEVYNTQYGNMKITDDSGKILTIYGTYSADGSDRYDAMDVKPVAGDTVKIYGVVGQYNGTAQVKNGWIVEHTPAASQPDPEPKPEDPAADSTLTVEEVIALGKSKDHNVYTEGKYYVVGVITEVYNTQYGNMKITDEAGNILTIYGTYSADGSTRYDKMDVKPVAGDTVKVYGIVGQYNGDAQVKNGWIVEHTPAPCEHTNTEIVGKVEATETTEGYTGDTKCTDCGETIATGEKIPVKTPVKPAPTGDAMIIVIEAVLVAGAALTVISRKRRFN